MFETLKMLLSTVLVATRSRSDLLLEIAALRQQIEVYQRQVRRPRGGSKLSRRIVP